MTDITEIIKQLEEVTAECDKNRISFYKKYPYSVSKMKEHLKAEFDKEAVAKKLHYRYYGDHNSKYYHMMAEDILALWDANSEKGRSSGIILDNFIGLILTGESQEQVDKYVGGLDESCASKCRSFKKFYDENVFNKLVYYGRELVLADPATGINGRLDALFGYKNCLLLVDWKQTKDINKFNVWEKMRGPVHDWDNCELNEYTIQLYIYAYILRNVYKITDIRIVPMIVQITEDGYVVYTPNKEYSDVLIGECIAYAIEQIDAEKEKKIKNK